MKSINKNENVLTNVNVEVLEKKEEYLTIIGVTVCCFEMSCCWKI